MTATLKQEAKGCYFRVLQLKPAGARRAESHHHATPAIYPVRIAGRELIYIQLGGVDLYSQKSNLDVHQNRHLLPIILW